LRPADLPSEQTPEHFLTALSKTGITTSTQSQAFNATIFSQSAIDSHRFCNFCKQ